MKRDFLTLKDYSTAEIRQLLDLAKDIKANPTKYREAMKGKELAMIFQKTSTRTRISFEVGMHQMGGNALYLDWRTTNLTLGTIEDEIKCMSRYVSIIMARVYDHKDIELMAKAATVPVINGLSDDYHPCQALADILTIEEKMKTLKGIRVGFIGDGTDNVLNSLTIICVRLGIPITIICPKEYWPKPILLDWLKQEKLEHLVTITSDTKRGPENVDVLYTDTFVSMGQEAETKQRLPIFQPYQLNKQIVKATKKNPLIMHCLPAHRDVEISSEVLDSPQSIVFDQAENRVCTQQALLYFLLNTK
jgi:ornithine carbamoyltransferase